jgi:RimJ/RimL family protein N-acetyltransferase
VNSRFRDFDLSKGTWSFEDSNIRIGSIPYSDNFLFDVLRNKNSTRLNRWWVFDIAAPPIRDAREYGFWISGKPAGVLTLWDIDPEQKTARLSYWIDEPWENAGYTTRMVQVLLQHLSDVHNLNTVYAIIQPSNLSSVRVAEKVGMAASGSGTYQMMDGSMAEHITYKKDL